MADDTVTVDGHITQVSSPIGRRAKLLFVVTEDWYFCSHRLPLAVGAREAGYDVTVVTRMRDHGAAIRASGIGAVPFDMSRNGVNPVSELATVGRLTRLYQRLRPDIVHHVALKPVVLGTLAARLAGVPGVVNAVAGMGWLFTEREDRGKGYPGRDVEKPRSRQDRTGRGARILGPLVSRALGGLLKRGRTIVQNPHDQTLLIDLGVPAGAISVIRGSGAEMTRFTFQPERPGAPCVLLASRMLWDKGIGEFVEAARRLKQKGVNARFQLAGPIDPDNPGSIGEEQLRAWEREGTVECLGPRGDMPAVLEAAHLVCLPTYYREGVPKVLIEAAACGRAIVTTDMPGCREVVRDGDNGLLVPPRDVAALEEAIGRLISDEGLRKRMGARGREIAEQEFSVARVIDETLRIYEGILS